MYFETVDCATVKPSLSSSPWIRGAPHSGFSSHMRRTRSRNSGSILGRPPGFRDFPTPPRTETHTVPANDGFRANDRDGIADIREIPIEADEDRPIKCV